MNKKLMKKVMMMAMMVAAATSAFAQTDALKEAKKLFSKGDLEQAITTVTPVLNEGTAADKAAAYNLLSEINYKIFSDNQQKQMENTVKQVTEPYDTLKINKAIYGAMEAALKCDEFDQQPNEKGKVKMKFRTSENQAKMQNVRLQLINAGLYQYNHKNLDEAFKNWALYIDSSDNPFFTGVDMSKDEYKSEIAYYAGLVAYQKKDYANAEKYAKIAAQDPKKAGEAQEILLFSQKENCKTKEDSLRYLSTVKELRKQNPSEQRYFNLLMDYYTQPGRMEEMKAFAEEEIAFDPQNKMAWALKGEYEMNSQQWDAAVESYKKAQEIDPEFVQVVFNAGVCLNSKAIALKDQLADKKTGNLTVANANKVKEILGQAKVYLEKSRELDPDQEKVKWAYPLYQLYYALGDSAKSAEMEKLLNNN